MDNDISSINKDYKYQRVEWKVEIVFWTLMLFVLVYGLLGGFGDTDTFLNRKKIEVSGTLVEYERYLRVEKSVLMKVSIGDSVRDCSIAFNADYINKIRITQVIPEPENVEVNDNQIIYKFNSFKSGTITFFKDPIEMGYQSLDLEINGKKASLSQFVYF